MPLAVFHEPVDHPDWLFEIKYDGFRALARLEAGTVGLISRNRNAFKSFPGLCVAVADGLRAESAVLDGEIVYLGRDGRPEFYNLMRRRSPQHFYAFDILWLDGKDLRQMPLLKSKQILRATSCHRNPHQCCTLIISRNAALICSALSARRIWKHRGQAEERPVHARSDLLGEDQDIPITARRRVATSFLSGGRQEPDADHNTGGPFTKGRIIPRICRIGDQVS
jgi:hypothetical protein